MATVQKDGVILINGYNLSGYLNEFSHAGEQDLHDDTTFAVSGGARTYKPGLSFHSISANGFREASSTDESIDIDGLFNSAIIGNVSLKISVSHQPYSIGGAALIFTAEQAKYDVKLSVGDLMMIALEMRGADRADIPAFQEGIWLYNGSTNTTPANAASVDLGAGSTGARLLVHNYGNEDAVVTLQHSTDNVTFVDVTGFDALDVSANSHTESSDTAISINRYIRLRHAAYANTTNIGATFVEAFAGI